MCNIFSVIETHVESLRVPSSVNPLTTADTISLQFGHMLSVGTVCFEDKFCARKKGGIGEVGGCQHMVPYTWQLL